MNIRHRQLRRTIDIVLGTLTPHHLDTTYLLFPLPAGIATSTSRHTRHDAESFD